MIQAENINKSFGSLDVLKDVSIHIKSGEVVSIVGASGAGKTTLLQILGTLDQADSGKVKYGDQDIQNFNSAQLAEFRNKNIGFVFQFHHLLPEFTALENVCIPGLIGKRNKSELENEAKEILTFLGLGERLNHKPSELSGGEQQRVAVARAIINKPAVVFADEPSGNLDSQTADELHKLFFSLRDKYNQTIVIVTHNRELANMSDRIISMRDGKILSE